MGYITGNKLKKRQALLHTARLWIEIKSICNQDISLGNLKLAAEKTLNYDFTNECPCCEYVLQKSNKLDYRECMDHCPLKALWPRGCEYNDYDGKPTVYYKARTLGEEYIEICADAIIKQCIKELLNEQTRAVQAEVEEITRKSRNHNDNKGNENENAN